MAKEFAVVLNGNEMKFELPTEKVDDVAKADEMLVVAEYLTAIAKLIKDNCSDAVILNGGSDNFSAVSATETKNVDWKGLAEHLEISQDDIDRFTKITAKKAYVKKKPTLVTAFI